MLSTEQQGHSEVLKIRNEVIREKCEEQSVLARLENNLLWCVHTECYA